MLDSSRVKSRSRSTCSCTDSEIARPTLRSNFFKYHHSRSFGLWSLFDIFSCLLFMFCLLFVSLSISPRDHRRIDGVVVVALSR